MEEMDELGIKRQSSIEKEPRTLNIHQIQFAREAALYVVNTRSLEDALRIFTEGLEPVARCAESGGLTDGDDDARGAEQDPRCRNSNDHIVRVPSGLRDIVSAPF